MKKTKPNLNASAVIISVLIISAIMIIVVIGMSSVHNNVADEYLNNLLDKNVFYNSEACLEESINRLELNPDFTGTTIMESANRGCTATVNGSYNVRDIAVTSYDGVYTQQYTGEITITQNGTVNNAVLTKWEKNK